MSPVWRKHPSGVVIGAVAAALLLGPSADRLVDPGTRGCGAPASPATGNCRFWGLTGPAPSGLIDDHLRTGLCSNFKLLSARVRDGWGIVSFPTDSGASALRLPLARRGGVSAGNPYDPDFDLCVEELAGLRPSAALAHIRRSSSGPVGIPDPHPFVREGFAFAHNGSVDIPTLHNLLIGDDLYYLLTHPPAYGIDYVDSELYFIWLLKVRHRNPTMTTLDALQLAVSVLHGWLPPQRLNFVLTRGDTLWVCRCANADSTDPVCFYPGATEPPSPFWVVCSAVVGSDCLEWGTVPAYSIGMFVPDRPPVFVSVNDPAGVHGPGLDPAPSDAGERSDWLGEPRPNPAGGSVLIPVATTGLPSPLRVEIWNAAGALLWEDNGARSARTLDGAGILWPGCDREGRAVPPGVYFCRVRAGTLRAERKITVLR